MYVEIKENKLLSWCENPYLDYEFVDIDYSTFDSEKHQVVDGVLIDMSNTAEYLAKNKSREISVLRRELLRQIDELDKKRVRAICEPEIKDKKSGQTWREFYTLQIQDYREQLEKLKQNGENYATN